MNKMQCTKCIHNKHNCKLNTKMKKRIGNNYICHLCNSVEKLEHGLFTYFQKKPTDTNGNYYTPGICMGCPYYSKELNSKGMEVTLCRVTFFEEKYPYKQIIKPLNMYNLTCETPKWCPLKNQK